MDNGNFFNKVVFYFLLIPSIALVAFLGYQSFFCNPSSPCLEVGESCSDTSLSCCHGRDCVDGRCCRGIGADLALDDPASVCCSGHIRTGPYGPYCCGTEGMVVRSADRCCEGLNWNSSTGRCEAPRCPPGCTWNPAMLSGEGDCDCPDGEGPEVVACPTCMPCPDPSADNCWVYLVYHEGYSSSATASPRSCRLYGPYCATSDAEARNCAMAAADAEGLSSEWRLIFENISDSWPPALDPCIR